MDHWSLFKFDQTVWSNISKLEEPTDKESGNKAIRGDLKELLLYPKQNKKVQDLVENYSAKRIVWNNFK